MAGIVPNTGATYARQAVLDTVDLEIMQGASSLTGVVSGCAVTAPGGTMTVAVAAGVVRIAGKPVTVSGATSSSMTAHASLPKWYLVTINSSGSVVVTAGTQAADPVLPAIPATSVVLAAVYLPAAVSAITSGMLVDKRVTVIDTRIGIIVAASDAPGWMKAGAHFQCDGIADDVEIQAAIDLAQTYVGSSTRTPDVYLVPGAYRVSSTITGKSARVIGRGAPNSGVRIYWDGAGGGTFLTQGAGGTYAGSFSFGGYQNLNLREGTGTPATWLDLTGGDVDQQWCLSHMHFGKTTGAAILMAGWVNLQWHHLRFDNWGTYAIKAVPGAGQTLSSFNLENFTGDSREATGKGFIWIDNTADSSNLGSFRVANGRLEVNTDWVSPASMIALTSPVAGNSRTIGIQLENVTYQDVSATASDYLIYSDTASSTISISLTLINVRQSGLTGIVGGTLSSSFPTIPVQGAYGFLSVAQGSGVIPDIMAGRFQINTATITSGTGAPSASEPDGSIYLRTDGAAGTTLYVRASGAWSANA